MVQSSPHGLKNYLHILIRQTKSDLEKRFHQAKIEITPFQYSILHQLKHGSLTLNELSRQMSFRPPSLIHSVDDLEAGKFLVRQQDPTDRRKIHLLISAKGSALLKKIPLDDRRDSLNAAFKKLPKPQQKQLLELLNNLTTNLGTKL